jgi:6-phosphogluconolactonase
MRGAPWFHPDHRFGDNVSAFNKVLLAALAAASLANARAQCAGQRIYIGTHQQGGTESVFTASFDEAAGAFGPARAVAAIDRPTWLVKDPARPVLYAVSETGNDGLSAGGVYSFRIGPAGGDLVEINHVESGGGGATHLDLDARSDTLFVANFGTGTVAAVGVGGEGALSGPTSIVKDHGGGPHVRQKSPHAHGVTVDPSHQFVLVPDMGADRIFIYRFAAGKRELVPAATPFLQLPPGSGPRHLVFGPNGRSAYLLTELSADLHVYRWDAGTGTLHPLQVLPTLPPGFQGTRSAGEIVVAGEGRHLYVSNRGGEDSIVAYAVDPDSGALSEIQRIASGGKQPWHLALSPAGAWLLAANESSNAVTAFRVDRGTGRLSATDNRLDIPTPVDTVFAGACPGR